MEVMIMAVLAQNYSYIKSENNNVIQLVKQKEPKKETNKKKGKKSEVYPYEIEDARRMLNFFKENDSWLHYLLLTFGCK